MELIHGRADRDRRVVSLSVKPVSLREGMRRMSENGGCALRPSLALMYIRVQF